MNRQTSMPFKQNPNPPSPLLSIPFGLRYIARHLVLGVDTMIHFAWLSANPRARKVAAEWNAADKAARQCMDLEAVCEKAGIRDGEFIGAVAAVAFELQVDVSELIKGISDMPRSVCKLFDRAALDDSPEGLLRQEAMATLEAVSRSVVRAGSGPRKAGSR